MLGPRREGRVHLRDHPFLHGRVLEQPVEETGAGGRAVEEGVAVDHLGVRDHVLLGERSAREVGGAEQEIHQIGLTVGSGRLAAMLGHDVLHESEHPGPRQPISRAPPCEGRIAPEPRADGDPGEGHRVLKVLAEGAIRHGEADLLADDEATDLR
jgi:hypothetical protein